MVLSYGYRNLNENEMYNLRKSISLESEDMFRYNL